MDRRVTPARPHSGLRRAIGMLVAPGRTWRAVAEAPASGRALMLGYVAPLAAIPAVSGTVGALAFGLTFADVGVRMSPLGLALGAAAGYVATLAAVWLLGWLIDMAAPAFGGRRGVGLNLAAYAGTASWVAGSAELYPGLGLPVGILGGLYSLYALHLGLGAVAKIPEPRRLTAFAAILVVIGALAAGRAVVVSAASELGGPLATVYAPR